MKIISVKQLREDFSRVKEGIERGDNFLLIYRSKPLAELRPANGEDLSMPPRSLSKKEALKKVEELAGGFRLGIGLSPEELNKFRDKSYEELLS